MIKYNACGKDGDQHIFNIKLDEDEEMDEDRGEKGARRNKDCREDTMLLDKIASWLIHHGKNCEKWTGTSGNPWKKTIIFEVTKEMIKQ